MIKPCTIPLIKDISNIPLPVMCSFKIKGDRTIMQGGNLYNKSMELISKSDMYAVYEDLLKISDESNMTLDGVVSNNVYHCSDLIIEDDYDMPSEHRRLYLYSTLGELISQQFRIIFEHRIHEVDRKKIHDLLGQAKNDGYEGLIIKSWMSGYKQGANTIKDQIIYEWRGE